MRKQDKIVVWPIYFDSTKTRKDGRKIPKGLAIPSPKILELKKAVETLGLEYDVVMDAGYPKTPWLKTGMILIRKREEKNKIIKKIAKQLVRIRKLQ
jgi:signal recognition particle subunit SRP19